MRHSKALPLLLLAAVVSSCAAPAGPRAAATARGAAVAAVTEREVRGALARTLPLLQGSMDVWIGEQECISCHHQGLGTMAVALARERGLPVDEELDARQIRRLVETAPGGALHGDAGINGTFGRSFQLLALAAAGVPRDGRTDAVAHFLAGNAERHGARVLWRSVSYRPPLEASSVTGTAVALRALDLYRPDSRAEETGALAAGAARWLAELAPADGEERALRLLGLAWAGAERSVVRAAGDDVLRAQRPDGGWAQLDDMESDAYATGQALVALHAAGVLAPADPAFARGARFLLERQLEDGSWLVRTRRRSPGLPYFETGFPHGTHQFISTAATAWSAMALCCALDARPSSALSGERPRRAADEPDLGLADVHRAAAFGTLADLRRALDLGADASARGADDLTPLHLAVRDGALTGLLLERGAEVDARTTHGATPLVLAAWYGGDSRAAELLLAAGADPNARAHEDGMTPLLRAVRAGKPELVTRLVAAGADPAALDVDGLSALHWAAAGGDAGMARLLLDLGARPDLACDGATALHWVAQDGREEVLRVLLERGADPNLPDDTGMTALAWAAKVDHGHGRLVRALLEAGGDDSVPCELGRTPVEWARHFGNGPALAELAAASAAPSGAER